MMCSCVRALTHALTLTLPASTVAPPLVGCRVPHQMRHARAERRLEPGSGGVSKEAAMTSARDIMHSGAQCVGERETLDEAARKMRSLDVGALPICGEDDRLHGIITDRDIVVKCLA